MGLHGRSAGDRCGTQIAVTGTRDYRAAVTQHQEGESVTTLWSCEVKCACCGLEQTRSVLGSTNELGPGDLDMRPGEMRRSTMGYWMQQCAGCGFVAANLAESTETDRDIVGSSAYAAELKSRARPLLANLFVGRSILDEAAGDLLAAGTHRLHAAWVCDDAELTEEARALRRAALEFFESARTAGKALTEEPIGGDEMLLTDLARRCGDFERARRYYDAGLGLEVQPFVRGVLELQRQLCVRTDSACHSVGDVDQLLLDEASGAQRGRLKRMRALEWMGVKRGSFRRSK